ncbi:hypothetical protein [Dactylosporangium sp. NPDC005555]|uniref:hypothetical protein n=1 Tax=Dactylosporangium sp. NPDC005555 TaxID=3154889 RepID=UPI0033B4538D
MALSAVDKPVAWEDGELERRPARDIRRTPVGHCDPVTLSEALVELSGKGT